MRVGDLVLFVPDRSIGIVVEVAKNTDCRCLFDGEIFICAQSQLELLCS